MSALFIHPLTPIIAAHSLAARVVSRHGCGHPDWPSLLERDPAPARPPVMHYSGQMSAAFAVLLTVLALSELAITTVGRRMHVYNHRDVMIRTRHNDYR